MQQRDLLYPNIANELRVLYSHVVLYVSGIRSAGGSFPKTEKLLFMFSLNLFVYHIYSCKNKNEFDYTGQSSRALPAFRHESGSIMRGGNMCV